MLLSNSQTMSIDIRATSHVSTVTFIQQDNNVLIINLLDGNSNADLSNVGSILVNLKRPDGVIYTHYLTWVGNVITYPMTTDDTGVSGIAEAEIQLYSSDDVPVKLSTRAFKINILAAIGGAVVQATSPDVGILNDLIAKVTPVVNSKYSIVTKSPDGTKYEVTIDNNGNISTNPTTKDVSVYSASDIATAVDSAKTLQSGIDSATNAIGILNGLTPEQVVINLDGLTIGNFYIPRNKVQLGSVTLA